MKRFYQSHRSFRQAGSRVIILLFFLIVTVIPAGGGTVFFGKHDHTVVLDPGHGGKDTGAKGVAGLLEKSITLQFANLLQKELAGRYNVYLTRNDDYQVSTTDRSAVANHYNGDVFISIHAGGAFRRQTSGMAVFTYGSEFHDLSARPPSTPDPVPPDEILPWDRLQTRHLEESRKLAAAIRENLTETGVFEIRSPREAPLTVLAAADTPAVLLEIATITNPMDESSIQKPGNLALVAKAVAGGIDRYLGIPPE